ncbi:MAG: T9SS type A sorting domain-containing protein [Crocinitomicaceae bacterium]
MKATIFTFLLFASVQLNAQIVSIPDQVFKSYLLNRPDINTNGDSEIQVSEANSFTDTIGLFNQGLSSLVGIEAFVNLSFLGVPMNNISSIDLSQNTQLKAFICPLNNISSLDVSNNLLLEELVVWDNNLSALDVTMLPNLRRLEINTNSINSIDISQNPLLEVFYAPGNQIGNKDYSIYPNLTKLDLMSCSVTSIDLSQNPLLTNVNLMANDITVIDFSQNTLLEYINCNVTGIFQIDVSMCPNIYGFSTAGCDNLESINLQNGNNTNINPNVFQTSFSPNLTCFQVDDVAYSSQFWATSVDDINAFSLDCWQQASLEENELVELNCYPNPMQEVLNVTGKQNILDLKLFSEIGQLVFEATPNAQEFIVNTREFSPGVYFVQVYFEGGGSLTQKVVK